MPKDDNKKDGEDNDAASEKSHRNDDDDTAGDQDQLTPVRPKIGEGPGNLGRREDWFRKRSGG